MDTTREDDVRSWAESLMSGAELGSRRRVKTAQFVLSTIATGAGKSLPGMCEGRSDQYERIARFARNEGVPPAELIRSGCDATARKLRESAGVILCIQDTTTLSYAHASIAEDLGELGGPKKGPGRGFQVHTSLAVSGETGGVLGVLDKMIAVREAGTRGKKHQRKTRRYEDKESFKWEAGFRSCWERGYSEASRLVFVSDRESDVHYYLTALVDEGARYVVRNAQNRRLDGETACLLESLEAAPDLGQVELFIPQRGGRPARTTRLEIRARSVVVRAPK